MKGISMAACILCAAMLVSGTQVFARGSVQVVKAPAGENAGMIKGVAGTTSASLLRPASPENAEQKNLVPITGGTINQVQYHHPEEPVSYHNHVMPIQEPGMLNSTDNTEKTYISREKAKQIAQRSAPSGALMKSMSLKSKNGTAYYEGWLKKDGIRYAFRIDAVSGSIIDYTTEVDPHWDPEAHHDVDSLREEDKGYKMKWDD